ncbi:MAG TPA: hypothetical protein VJP59_00820 [Gemmatimonadota bacterium]|nr:hypothetical protein [Gemmatimonadota bacterium]
MSAAAWVTMAAVCGFVWGGALTLVAIAMRKEGRKSEPEPATPRA